MLLLGLLIAQPVSDNPATIIDLTVRNECPAPSRGSDEIVICAPGEGDPDRFRLPQSLRGDPDAEVRPLPKAEISLSENAVASAEAEQVEIGGAPSRRAVVRVKIGF